MKKKRTITTLDATKVESTRIDEWVSINQALLNLLIIAKINLSIMYLKYWAGKCSVKKQLYYIE